MRHQQDNEEEDKSSDALSCAASSRDATSKSETIISTRAGKRKGSEWEILGNLEKGVAYTIKPRKYEGSMLKRRKWPLKGWHKRYFVIEQGILTYGKTSGDITRGRTLGKFNIGEAVISANYGEMRIDIDAEESVHHVKLDNMEEFALFLEQLQQHRLYVQHLTNTGQTPLSPLSETGERVTSPPGGAHWNSLRRMAPGRASLIAEFAQLDDSIVRQLDHVQNQLAHLVDVINRLEPEAEHPSHQKRKLFHLRKKKSNQHSTSRANDKDRSSPVLSSHSPEEEGTATNLLGMTAMSGSNPSLCSQVSQVRPTSLPTEVPLLKPSRSESGTTCRDEVLNLTQEIQGDVGNMVKGYIRERDHLKMLLENENKTSSLQPSVAITASLRQSLNAALQQNTALRTRLARIHAESDIGDLPITPNPDTSLSRGVNPSLSYSSSCISEFFDAREYADSAEDTDDDDDDASLSCGSTGSSPETEDETFLEATGTLNGKEDTPPAEPNNMTALTGRRRALPVPKTDTEGVNLWNLLCKNIGKDLSKISMPVTLNEPLSVLQRICEELEYCELLEKAVSSENPLERMQWVAAFAVSAYGSYNTRASHKPFNPLLGETFECVRDDKGFKYIAEQVSHHPPVTAAHAVGTGWTWSQSLRLRSKFWGKSMEFQPEGSVELEFEVDGRKEKYVWNKVTSCIHNLLGAERWVDLYGESVINCEQTGLTAKIQFVKASYWSNKRHEVFGTVTDYNGTNLQNLFGKWSEALYVGKAPSARCIWRPGALPDDAELYYGFSRFAIELNELVSAETKEMPPTDTRWRPDQRALEEGRVAEAENIKLGVEQAQRDRRRQRDHGQLPKFRPMWFRQVDNYTEDEDENATEKWAFNNKYWSSKSASFQDIEFEPLW